MNVNYQNGIAVRRRATINIRNLLVCCFVLWPLFWNLCAVLKLPNRLFGSNFSVYVLWILAILLMILNKRIKKTPLNIWILFFAVIIVEVVLTGSYGAVFNISVIICGFFIASLLTNKDFNYLAALKCLFYGGLFICITLLVDEITGLFSNTLVKLLYTKTTADVFVRHTERSIASGGILPYSASAGCFINSGFIAFYTLKKIQNKKVKYKDILIGTVFIICMILIQKRGLIIDFILSFLFIWLLSRKKRKNGVINLNRVIRTIAITFLIVITLISLYNYSSFFKKYFDLFLMKFNQEDITSGRFALYQFAFDLFKKNKLIGIGWGNYRKYTLGFFGVEETSYAAHNVYIQLLCETGLLGLIVFLLVIIVTFKYGLKKYKKIISANNNDYKVRIVWFGLFLQVFFILYCVTGNPLYDYNFLITYFIGVLFTTIPITSVTQLEELE